MSEVLKQVDIALSPPVKCRMRTATLEAVVSRKKLSNGRLASRTEAVTPSQAILISYDDANFEILPLSHMVIDKTQIEIDEYLTGRLRCNENALSFIPEVPPGFTVASKEMETITRDGKTYYKIRTRFNAWILKAANNLQGLLQDGFPASHVLLVDKSNMQPVELQSFSMSGKVLMKYEYIDITHPDDIPDELFHLPEDYDTQTPHDLDEYYDIHKKAWTEIHPNQPRFWPRVYISKKGIDSLKDGKKHEKTNHTGITIGKTTVAQLEQAAERLPKTTSPSAPPGRSGRWTLVLMNVALITVVAGLLFRRLRSTPK